MQTCRAMLRLARLADRRGKELEFGSAYHLRKPIEYTNRVLQAGTLGSTEYMSLETELASFNPIDRFIESVR